MALANADAMSPPDAAFRVYSTNFFTLPEDFVLSWRIEGVKLFDIMTATVSMSATMLTATAAGSLPALRDNDIIAGLLILLLASRWASASVVSW